MTGFNDVFGVGELEAAGSALIEAYERGYNLGDWRPIHERMRIASCKLCGWSGRAVLLLRLLV